MQPQGWSRGGKDDYEKLFHDDMPQQSSVPPVQNVGSLDSNAFTYQANAPPNDFLAPPPADSDFQPSGTYIQNTLDEPVFETFKRDFMRIGRNVSLVAFPFAGRTKQEEALRNWDLWGPMIFTLVLAIALSHDVEKDKVQTQFSIVFGLIAVGAIVLTLNVLLLGGSIVFFQALCLLGYCLFPLDLAAIAGIFIPAKLSWIRVPVVLVALLWAFWAAVPFVGGSVSEKRRTLAVYPVFLLYSFLAWLALVQKV